MKLVLIMVLGCRIFASQAQPTLAWTDCKGIHFREDMSPEDWAHVLQIFSKISADGCK